MESEDRTSLLSEPSISLGDSTTEPKAFAFYLGQKCALRLTPEGFEYEGVRIRDHGEAYRLFRDWLEKANAQA